MTVVLQSGEIDRAVDLLSSGGIVAFPTDTVYGLGAAVWKVDSVARLYLAKDRPAEKAIPVLLADAGAAAPLMRGYSPAMQTLVSRYWPGPLTLVVQAAPGVPDIVTGGAGTVALRVPDHPLARALLARTGPLAVTSANRSGWESPASAQAVLGQLAGRIDAILDGGECPGGIPSTVLDLTCDPPRVLRMGPVADAELTAVLHDRIKVH